MDQDRVRVLKETCLQMRRDLLTMAEAAGSSGLHFGGSLSMIEIAAALYLDVMSFSKECVKDEKRDRVILSKGHGVPTIYAALTHCGVLDREALNTFKTPETVLYGHPYKNPEIGIEVSTGSLGQGLSLGVGIALGLKHKGNEKSKVFVILGDGECDEGSVWEAAMSASRFGLNHLMVIVDRNKLQYDGETENVMPLESLKAKWQSFGWTCLEIDGHDVEACCEAFRYETDRPVVVIANTIKGKGISFMENDPTWHHRQMTKAETEKAKEELAYVTL